MKEILYPMFALVLLTFCVGLSLGATRLISVRKGQVDRRYYKLMSEYTPPEYVAKLERNFSNLFEVPILFYILGVLIIALGVKSQLILFLSWIFVALRAAHSLIHITYNHPIHRFLVFLSSSLIVLIMWVQLVTIISKT